MVARLRLRFYSGLFATTEDYVFRHYVVAWLSILLVWARGFRDFEFLPPAKAIDSLARDFGSDQSLRARIAHFSRHPVPGPRDHSFSCGGDALLDRIALFF
jgi:hypothetical protein